jgi:hypothetical protein
VKAEITSDSTQDLKKLAGRDGKRASALSREIAYLI